MTFEWVSPASVAVAAAASYGALRQSLKGLSKSMDELVTTNRQEHERLWDAHTAEAAKRADEDKEIRKEYVTVDRCLDCPARHESVKKADCERYRDGGVCAGRGGR